MLSNTSGFSDIRKKAGTASLRLAPSGDYQKDGNAYKKAFSEADGIVFERLGVAVINPHHEEQINELRSAARTQNTFVYSEPERYLYALDGQGYAETNRWRNLWDAVCQIFKPSPARRPDTGLFDFDDDSTASWGIHALRILDTRFTGKGVNIAILDTGFNLGHPDFADRVIKSESFIEGEKVEDLNGHGTHCTGIAAGSSNKSSGVRYGVAKEANIYIGKVLSNQGSGSDSSILAGIEWALTNKCQVISMSLGAAVSLGETYSNIYNDIGKLAMAQGTIIIAAAGNESNRNMGVISPVGHPANCPSIMAVGALNSKMDVANFSCGGLNPNGGQVDVGAPGVAVYSAYKSPDNYGIISGTSMATPYVAGIAALYYEEKPESSASEIWMKITQNARRLDLPATDVGAGLVQPVLQQT